VQKTKTGAWASAAAFAVLAMLGLVTGITWLAGVRSSSTEQGVLELIVGVCFAYVTVAAVRFAAAAPPNE
jgi:hypothetical protein